MFPQLLEKLSRHEDLTGEEAAAAMTEIMAGRAAPTHMAGLLVGLAMKGERPIEISGWLRRCGRTQYKSRKSTSGSSIRVARAVTALEPSIFHRVRQWSSRRVA